MTSPLRSEADLIRALETGTYTVKDLYERAVAAGLADRPGGRTIIRDGQEQYKRRVRTALQDLRRRGRARRVTDQGAAAWLIEGSTTRTRRALFVLLPHDLSQLELVLGRAAQVLQQADEPIDLIVADPPWALGRGRPGSAYRRTYGRNHRQVVDGYVDVDPEAYADFTAEWVAAAGAALRPGGYLAVVTGAQQAARVQVAAEDVGGLTYVNSIVVPRAFGMYTTRRFVHSHHRVTVLTKGALESPQRVFERPAEMPRGRNGHIYATDVWADIPEERRVGLLRYDNALPTGLVSRVVRSTTREGDLVADPFNGSGTTAVVCLTERRRFYGGDVNPNSLRFTMARILAEVVPAMTTAAAVDVPRHMALAAYDPWAALLEEAVL
ncbi:site-specific DNA-methyltransferase [Micromonospora sp. C51]|uniref:DNA-methyltransferase n=1 Tax=Micromonospora sp. C51 TaxID=2824879 RepID=UPI001B394F9A|nr:site-specific DNA-methyltransferase [Micromonospora sp. C51]MBQ1048481.1 site-specific DNA-methyltransferase [Micromonospora sp. C51]